MMYKYKFMEMIMVVHICLVYKIMQKVKVVSVCFTKIKQKKLENIYM